VNLDFSGESILLQTIERLYPTKVGIFIDLGDISKMSVILHKEDASGVGVEAFTPGVGVIYAFLKITPCFALSGATGI
jgi:hypothetical protein